MPGQKQPARIGHADDAGLGEVEAADFVARAVAILDRAEQPQARVPLAFEMQHDVDKMFEHARPGDRSVFGDVADQHHRDVALFRDGDQRRRDMTHLGDAACRAVDVGDRHGLHRVDDEQPGLDVVEMPQHRSDVGFGGKVEVRAQAR